MASAGNASSSSVELLAAPPAPVRSEVEQVGTRQAQHEDGGVGKLDDRFDEIEERGWGPVHVFDDEEQRALVREAGEQPAGREGGVLGLRGSLRESDGDCELVGQARGVVGPQPSAKPLGRVAVGELVAVREAARTCRRGRRPCNG